MPHQIKTDLIPPSPTSISTPNSNLQSPSNKNPRKSWKILSLQIPKFGKDRSNSTPQRASHASNALQVPPSTSASLPPSWPSFSSDTPSSRKHLPRSAISSDSGIQMLDEPRKRAIVNPEPIIHYNERELISRGTLEGLVENFISDLGGLVQQTFQMTP